MHSHASHVVYLAQKKDLRPTSSCIAVMKPWNPAVWLTARVTKPKRSFEEDIRRFLGDVAVWLVCMSKMWRKCFRQVCISDTVKFVKALGPCTQTLQRCLRPNSLGDGCQASPRAMGSARASKSSWTWPTSWLNMIAKDKGVDPTSSSTVVHPIQTKLGVLQADQKPDVDESFVALYLFEVCVCVVHRYIPVEKKCWMLRQGDSLENDQQTHVKAKPHNWIAEGLPGSPTKSWIRGMRKW